MAHLSRLPRLQSTNLSLSSPTSSNIITSRPLFSLRSLTLLHIDTIRDYDLDDTTFKEMASTWPLLQVFRLSARQTNFRPRVTRNGLAALLSGCSQSTNYS